MGGDSATADFYARFGVSIHAPAWGATLDCRGETLTLKVSIHAPAWGATLTSVPSGIDSRFQSTPPHGGRHAPACPRFRIAGSFNPRPRMGGDPDDTLR
ncbi:hypothetical cytosolic protein [Syntrophus aciditrophicus SB]|uniref:Hypothetical cytosolic protein n=1 Tax=Syntrophus aciditrophicus (strain SB) TaxID=56780 RepID=Q2LWZ6_SYNAS|nr:hypothetical cytosolic protein [Syntrophus aciditrophicus SB]